MLRRCARAGRKSIALSLLFSFANPRNERLVAAALEPLGLPVSISHRILPEFREYERGATVVANAYLAPKMTAYISQLESDLTSVIRGFAACDAVSGGIVSASLAAREPVRTVLSGPAGGVIGAYRVACAGGFTKIIGFDMGGTSTDVCLIDAAEGGPKTTSESIVSGLPIGISMLDIHTVGAGGVGRWRGRCGRDAACWAAVRGSGAPGPICYARANERQ